MKFKKFKFKKVRSTNNTAIRIIKKTNCKYGMVISESQINGKGQYGRKWISHKGNLFVSFFHEINKIKLSIATITKLNCLLVKKLISKYTNKKILYKKPNDLLIEKKKVCGVLQEIIFMHNKKYLITGIGININKSPYIKKYPTTNLNDLTNKHIKISEIEKSLKQIFENNLFKMHNLKVNN
ncbi:biotin--[acetyl-CoA-carboxylase] ligase [Candidatus Pelagibacter sp.]|nr:biotin--[acetyl-CoA-carboxylase] ligase [Candidatus Pelagibacter sp.]